MVIRATMKNMLEAVRRIARHTNRTAFELVKKSSHPAKYVPRKNTLMLTSLGGTRYAISIGNGENWGSRNFGLAGTRREIIDASYIIGDAMAHKLKSKMYRRKGAKSAAFT